MRAKCYFPSDPSTENSGQSTHHNEGECFLTSCRPSPPILTHQFHLDHDRNLSCSPIKSRRPRQQFGRSDVLHLNARLELIVARSGLPAREGCGRDERR
jgi:hypothetical protein